MRSEREAIVSQRAFARERRQNGRIAGYLFSLGALSTIPSSLLLEPNPPPAIYALTLVGLLSGLACLAIPWERLPARAVDAVIVVGTVEVAAVSAAVGQTYAVLYFVVAIYAALVSRSRRALGAHLALIACALAAPVLYDGDSAQQHGHMALLGIPVLVIIAGAVRYLRESLEARERGVRGFARDAIELAIRINAPGPDRERMERIGRELDGG